MRQPGVDVLMITYNRPEYTRLSLERLLTSASENMRVWLWHNGTHEETLAIVKEYVDHPSVYKFHHSLENVKLRDPTNWILQEGNAEYVSKVDDDCLVPEGWVDVLTEAHEAEPSFGALGCWRFMPEDYDEAAAQRKIREFNGGHKVMCHPWVEGSGFLLKRRCVDRVGLLRPRESGITGYLIRVALKGWINGWYFPFLWQEHMDDPRAPHTLLKTDADFQKYSPLSAPLSGAETVAQWDQQLRNSAASLQKLPSNPAYYHPWRRSARRLLGRLGLTR